MWVQKIARPADYFSRCGFTVRHQIEWPVAAVQPLQAVLGLLDGNERLVALSYLNGLVQEYGVGSDFAEYSAGPVPCMPRSEIVRAVRGMTGHPDCAFHVRHGNLAAVAPLVGARLPGGPRVHCAAAAWRADLSGH